MPALAPGSRKFMAEAATCWADQSNRMYRANLPTRIVFRRMPMLKLSSSARTAVAAIVVVVAALALSRFVSPGAAEEAKVLPAPLADERSTAERETAVFAGGCFWGIQGVFEHVDGVIQ